jgi:glycerol-3-phosphate acyltransferase PlsY
LTIIAVFLAGIGIGDILSKSKHEYKLRSYGFQNSGSTAMIRVFVETPNGRDSAGITVPESAAAADVLMALRSRGWSPFALRAWIALVLAWRRAA